MKGDHVCPACGERYSPYWGPCKNTWVEDGDE